MCVRHSEEGCVLNERMQSVEKDLGAVKAQNKISIVLLLLLIGVLTLITLKLLNNHIYLISGEGGLHAVSGETRLDVRSLPGGK